MAQTKGDAKLMCKAKIGMPQRVCGVAKALHSGRMCPSCYIPVEHHNETEQSECWESRARMALVLQEVGPIELHYKIEDPDDKTKTIDKMVLTATMSDTDNEALRRCPDPEFLTEDGYRRRSEIDATE